MKNLENPKRLEDETCEWPLPREATAEELAWRQDVLNSMKRMSEDEEYRKEVVKRIH